MSSLKLKKYINIVNKTIYLNAQMDGTQKINLCKNLSSTVIFERTNPRVCCSSTHIYILYSVLNFGIFELNRSRLIRYYLRYFLLLHTFPNHLIHTMIRSYLSEHTNQHSFREIHSHHFHKILHYIILR